MIKIDLIKTNDRVTGIKVTGHANSAPYNNDLVCAAVSAIITGGFNAFKEEDISECSLKEGYAEASVITPHGEIILETIIVQLKTIEEKYPKNVKIK